MKVRFLFFVMLIFIFLAPTLLAAPASHKFEYISPKPGAKFVSKETKIIFRPGGNLDDYVLDQSSMFRVQGAQSGLHSGEVIIANDRKTIIFQPRRIFTPGETVTVEISIGVKNQGKVTHEELSLRFTISSKRTYSRPESEIISTSEWRATPPKNKPIQSPVRPNASTSGFSLPEDFPAITVNVVDNPDSGYIFVSNFSFLDDPPTVNYLMILDNTGRPIFFRKMPENVKDFKRQPNGLLTYYLDGPFKFYAMDNTYTVVDSFQAGNGYFVDTHDLQILPNGHALLLIYDAQTVDMSKIVAGGDTAATVLGLVVQELDEGKHVVFQWRSWDHFKINDAVGRNLTASRIDYVHGNAVELDSDGHILISSRHMSEITKIDRWTGEIIWRLGGKNNEFTFTNDEGFTYQHDIRRLPNGHITLFDNGNLHSPQYSRAVEYEIDEENKTVTKVWEYRNVPDFYGRAMGSAQRLPNANTLICWGATNPNVTEIRPDGSKAFELTFDTGIYSYRAFRYPWRGEAAKPYLWAIPDTANQTFSLNFTQFGKENVEKYYIYGGTSPNPTTIIDSTLENSVVFDSLAGGTTNYFRITSRDENGEESDFSNEVKITKKLITAIMRPTKPLPEKFTLLQNYPNPFNPATTIGFGLPEDAEVDLGVYNILGQEVRTLANRKFKAGFSSIVWDGKNNSGGQVGSGVYIFKLKAGDKVLSRKMLLLR